MVNIKLYFSYIQLFIIEIILITIRILLSKGDIIESYTNYKSFNKQNIIIIIIFIKNKTINKKLSLS